MPLPRVHTHIHVGPRPPPVIIDQGWHAGDPSIVVSQPRIRVKDIVILTGTGALLAYGFRNNYRQNINDAAGSREGTTVGSLTVALEVRRDNPNNILDRFRRLANAADTSSQRGLQELLSNVALELLRNEKSITSARAQSKYYASRSKAEREFQLLSVQGRSKVDRLTGTCICCCLFVRCSSYFEGILPTSDYFDSFACALCKRLTRILHHFSQQVWIPRQARRKNSLQR